MNEAKKLNHLQEVDLDLGAKNETLAAIQSQLGDNSAVREAAITLEQAQKWLVEMEKAQRFGEAESEDLGAKLHEVEGKLYSGKVTNLKELAGLQEEFEQLKTRLKQTDDRVMEVMGEVDAAQTSLKTQEQKFSDIKAQWERGQSDLARDSSKLQDIISQLQGKRDAMAQSLAPDSIKLYEWLRKTIPGGRVVAKMEQGKCMGCRLSLSIDELKRVRGSALVQCSSCRKILYID